MSYAKDHLISGESIVYTGKLHWTHVGFPVILFSFMIWRMMSGPGRGGITGLLVCVTLLGIFVTGLRYLDYASSEFVVSNKRVIIKSGVVRRRTLELFVDKVEGLDVAETIVGRMFGFGTLSITGTGGSKSKFRKLGKPLQFRKEFYEQVERNKNNTSLSSHANKAS